MNASEMQFLHKRARPNNVTAPNEDPFRLAIAEPTHDGAIDRLRQSAYAKAGYFTLPDPELLRRKVDPNNSICLIVANKSTIAATVRLGLAPDQKRAEQLLQGPAPLHQEMFPTLTLCRGATNPGFRGEGLMTFLVGLGVAIADRAGLASTTGMQAAGTPHFKKMIDGGWLSKDVPSDATECVRMETAVMKFVYISADRFGYSANYGYEHHAHLHKHLESANIIDRGARMIEKIRADLKRG